MRKKVLALVLFVAMLLALIPGGTASAATLSATVAPDVSLWQTDGSARTTLSVSDLATSEKIIYSLGSTTAAYSLIDFTSTDSDYVPPVAGTLVTRNPIVAGNTIYLRVDTATDDALVSTGGTITAFPVLTSAPSSGTAGVYLDTGVLKYADSASSTNVTTIADRAYVYSYAYGPYTQIDANGQSVTVYAAWSDVDDYSTWYGKPSDTSNGRGYYISVPVLISFDNITSSDIYVNGVSAGYTQIGINYYVNVNFLPVEGGNTATALIEVYDRTNNYTYYSRTMTLTYYDTGYSITANSTLSAKIIGKSGNQAGNFNVRLEGATIIVDVAAQTSSDIDTLNANAYGGGAIDRSNDTTAAATSTQKTNKDVNYVLTFKIQPLKADGTPYDYHTRIYPTAMKVYGDNSSFLIGSANRYQQHASGDPANHSYEVDADGYITISLKLTQKDLVEGYIKTNNKLSSNSYGSSIGSFSFTLGVSGSPKFTFDIVVNNVSRSSTTGTLSASELNLETGASTTLGVTYADGAFTTNTTFKAYSDGITVTQDGNTATVTAGATAGTYFVIVTTADGNITIVPVVVTDPAAAVDETAGTYTITGRGVRIRTAPDTSTSKNIAKTTKKGDKVEVTSITDGWALLADGNYISAKYLTKD